jgi:hypothetical protein
MNKPSRRHHYVPRFLLANFADANGKIWTYDSKAKKKWAGTPETTGFERDLNSVTLKNGKIEHSIVEDHLALTIDGPGSIAIGALLNRETLPHAQWQNFICFVAAQMLRTPSQINALEKVIAPVMQESLTRMAKYSDEFRSNVSQRMLESGASQETVDGILAEAGSGNTNVIPKKDFLLLLSLQQIAATQRMLLRLNWTFCTVEASDEDLVIGDQPVVLRDIGPTSTPPGPLGLSNPNIEVMMPLSNRMVAFGRWSGPSSYGTLHPGQADLINYHTSRNALRFVFSAHNSENLLSNFLQVAGSGPKVTVERIEEGGKLSFITKYQ